MSQVTIQLLDQHWSNGSRDRDGDPEDATSHGTVALWIDGQDLAGCDSPDTDYGINQSAVRLLQTAFADHQPVPWQPGQPYNPVFFHGCSMIGTCPNCVIDFRVRHQANDVVALDQFYVSGGSAPDPRRYHDRSGEIPLLEYAQQVRDFAAAALAFLPPVKGVDYERSLYTSLLAEHAFLLDLLDRCLRTGERLSKYRQRAAVFDVENCQLPARWSSKIPPASVTS